MTATKLVVFDCDGTLVDSQHMICAAMNAAFRACGLGLPDALAVRRVVGLSLVEAVAVLLPDADTALHIKVADLYKAGFRDLREQHHQEPLYPGTVDALKTLHDAGYLMGVATGKSRRGLDSVLSRNGLGHFFVTLQTADDAPGKPHPQMVLQAMDEAGASPANTIVVGDTSYDMGMAKAAGAAAIGVSWGYHEPQELTEHGASAVIRDYDELAPLVRRMIG